MYFKNDDIVRYSFEKRRVWDKELIYNKMRQALAAAMVNPIRTSLDYQGLGRKLLVVDPLPQGA